MPCSQSRYNGLLQFLSIVKARYNDSRYSEQVKSRYSELVNSQFIFYCLFLVIVKKGRKYTRNYLETPNIILGCQQI